MGEVSFVKEHAKTCPILLIVSAEKIKNFKWLHIKINLLST